MYSIQKGSIYQNNNTAVTFSYCIGITAVKSCAIQRWKSAFHTLTKNGHACKDPQELDFMGEIKRSVFGCGVRSGGLALLVKDTSRGRVYFEVIETGVEKVRASVDKKTAKLFHFLFFSDLLKNGIFMITQISICDSF